MALFEAASSAAACKINQNIKTKNFCGFLYISSSTAQGSVVSLGFLCRGDFGQA